MASLDNCSVRFIIPFRLLCGNQRLLRTKLSSRTDIEKFQIEVKQNCLTVLFLNTKSLAFRMD